MKFTINAVKGEKSYKHFGIHPITAQLYGEKREDIVELEFEADEDQTVPESNKEYTEADYWGWIYEGSDSPTTLMYPQYFLLNMCFPSGIKAAEESGKGKAYRFKLVGESK